MSTEKKLTTVPGKSAHRSDVPDTGRIVAPAASGELSGSCTTDAPLTTTKRSELGPPLVEWLRSIQEWHGYVPVAEIRALLDTPQTPERVLQAEPLVSHAARCDSGLKKKQARVCAGLACALAGSEDLCQSLQTEGYDITRETCLGRCWSAPAAIIGHRTVSGLAWTPSDLSSDREEDHESARFCLKDYMDAGGYGVLKSCLTGRRSIESILVEWSTPFMTAFEPVAVPLGERIKDLRTSELPPKLLLVLDGTGAANNNNAFYLEHNRHAVVEGLLIAALAARAREIIVHWSDPQGFEVRRLKSAISALAETCLDRHVRFTFAEPDGGDRGLALHLFAQSQAQGLLRSDDHRASSVAPILLLEPSLLRWLPEIISNARHWLASLSVGGNCPPELYLICGRVLTPGIYLAASGRSVRDLIQIAGGIEPGHIFESFVAGDWSNPALPSRLATVRLETRPTSELHASKAKTSSLTGSVVVISMSDSFSRQCVFATGEPAPFVPDRASEK